MRKYQTMYEDMSRKMEASSHIVARTLAEAWFGNRAESFDPAYVVVIDVDAAGYGKHTGHCQGCSPHEMCSRSGTCGWCDERYTDYEGNTGRVLHGTVTVEGHEYPARLNPALQKAFNEEHNPWRSLADDPPGPEHTTLFIGHSKGGRMDWVFRWPDRDGQMAFWAKGERGNYLLYNYAPDVWHPAPPYIPGSDVAAIHGAWSANQLVIP